MKLLLIYRFFAGSGTGCSGKMREAMSKVQAATKIDRKARREVRGLAFAGGLASAGGTEHPVPLSCCHSGAFMLSTMLICRTCRRMAKHTTKVNSIVNATASR